jgi:hypothetical protein
MHVNTEREYESHFLFFLKNDEFHSIVKFHVYNNATFYFINTYIFLEE